MVGGGTRSIMRLMEKGGWQGRFGHSPREEALEGEMWVFTVKGARRKWGGNSQPERRPIHRLSARRPFAWKWGAFWWSRLLVRSHVK